MSQIFVRTPVEGIFLGPTGELVQAEAVKGTVVQAGDPRVPADLVPRLAGVPLGELPVIPRGGGGGGLAELVGLDADVARVIELTASVIGTVSGVAGAVATGLKLIGWIGGGVSEYDVLYQRIDARMQQLLAQLSASGDVSAMQNIAEVLGHSALARTVTLEIAAGATPRPSSIDAADQGSRLAVETLAQEAYWTRPSNPGPFLELARKGGWGVLAETLPHTQAGALVRDHRLALPALLRALAIRMAFVRATQDTHDPAAVRAEFTHYAELLRTAERWFRESIVQSPTPTSEAKLRNPWGWGLPCGAVHVLGGTAWWVRAWVGPHTSGVGLPDYVNAAVAGAHPRSGANFATFTAAHRHSADLTWLHVYRAVGGLGFWTLIPDCTTFADGVANPWTRFTGRLRIRPIR